MNRPAYLLGPPLSVLDIYGSFCPGPCVCLTFVAHFWDNGNNTFVVSFDCAEFENFIAWKSQPGAPFIKLLYSKEGPQKNQVLECKFPFLTGQKPKKQS